MTDPAHCPDAPDGRHHLDGRTLIAFLGREPDDAPAGPGGAWYAVRCTRCGRAGRLFVADAAFLWDDAPGVER